MKQIFRRIRFISGSLFVLSLLNCGSPQIIVDTAKLDQAYIPLLFMTGQPETTQLQAIQLFDRFIRRWHLFYGHYQAANQINPAWGNGLDSVNITIRAVEDSLLEQSDLATIHKMLETVRLDLMTLRRNNQIGYALDELTAFHEIMEPMAAAAGQMHADSAKAEQFVQPILNHLEAAQKQWLRVQMVKFDPVLFNLDETDVEAFISGKSDLQNQLNLLERAVVTHDTPQIAATAKALKPQFVKIYLLFGDFGGSNQN